MNQLSKILNQSKLSNSYKIKIKNLIQSKIFQCLKNQKRKKNLKLKKTYRIHKIINHKNNQKNLKNYKTKY